MLDTQATIPWGFHALNKIAEYLRLKKLSFALLDEEVLCNEATKSTGLTDFGDHHYREGLSKLIESAKKDANLHFIGQCVLHDVITTFLSNRLLLAEVRKQSPEIFQKPIIPPIIILGMPRTGTTFLHRMLAVDPANRGIPFWELMRPISLHRIFDPRRQLSKIESFFHSKIIPKFDRIHFLRADKFEECIILFGTTFVSDFFWICAPIYGYKEWIMSHNKLKAYQEYYSLLQILQGVSPTRRLTLKAPPHTASLDQLMKVIPGALIIQNHRHPVPVCNSINSLICEQHNMTTKNHDRSRLAKINIDYYENAVASSIKWRDTNPNTIYDVYYDQLISDPISTVKGIYRHFKLDWSNDYEQQLKTFIRNNPKGKYGNHQYNSSDFGINDDVISKRFDAYIKRFGINNQNRLPSKPCKNQLL